MGSRKMPNKTFTKMLMMSLLLTSILSNAQSTDKVNFIQILTDDQGWGDLGTFGHEFIQSPNIDNLAKEGIKFTQCYAAASVCSPSRASIMTGRTPYRNGVYRWVPASHFCHLPASEITLPNLLKQHGYETAHFGKWHLGNYYEERIKDAHEQFENYGYDTNPDQPNMADYGYDYYMATGNVARPSHKNPQNFFLNGRALGEIKGFSAQILAKYIVDWIKVHRKKDAPFFITVWFHEPHGPIASDPKFTNLYKDLDDESLKQYLGNVTQIDDAVGTIVKALEEVKETDNTLIWYTSDNGPEGKHELGHFNKKDHVFGGSRFRGSTGGLRGRKRHTHEGGIRVPGIIKWPKGMRSGSLKQGSIIAEPIIGSDIFPTFLDLAGIDLPKDVNIDGTSLAPLIYGKKLKRKRPLFWRNNFSDERIALRDGDWKLIGNSLRTEFKLYNIVKDPRETSDWSKFEPKIFEKMKKILIAYDKEVLAEGPDWWKKEKSSKNMPVD